MPVIRLILRRSRQSDSAQNTDDEVQHTLLIDNMRVFTGSGTSPVASRPHGLSAQGFDSHVELRWHPNPEAYVTGYSIQRSVRRGECLSQMWLLQVRTIRCSSIMLPDLGTAVTVNYRIMASTAAGELSVPSDTVEATTRVFT